MNDTARQNVQAWLYDLASSDHGRSYWTGLRDGLEMARLLAASATRDFDLDCTETLMDVLTGAAQYVDDHAATHRA